MTAPIAIFNRLDADSLVAAALFSSVTGSLVYDIDDLVPSGLPAVSTVFWLGVVPTEEAFKQLRNADHIAMLNSSIKPQNLPSNKIQRYSHPLSKEEQVLFKEEPSFYSDLSIVEQVTYHFSGDGPLFEKLRNDEVAKHKAEPGKRYVPWLRVGHMVRNFDNSRKDVVELATVYGWVVLAYRHLFGRHEFPLMLSEHVDPSAEMIAQIKKDYLREYRSASNYLQTRGKQQAVPTRTGFVHAWLTDTHNESWYLVKRMMALANAKWVSARLHLDEVTMRTNITQPLSKKHLSTRVYLKRS